MNFSGICHSLLLASILWHWLICRLLVPAVLLTEFQVDFLKTVLRHLGSLKNLSSPHKNVIETQRTRYFLSPGAMQVAELRLKWKIGICFEYVCSCFVTVFPEVGKRLCKPGGRMANWYHPALLWDT